MIVVTINIPLVATLGARSKVRARIQDALARPVSPASAYLARRGFFAPSEVRRLVTEDVWDAAAKTFDPVQHIADRANNAAHRTDAISDMAWISRAEIQTYMHHQLLRDTDAMSMAHSLEVRVPLVDHRLVEYVLRLPAAEKSIGNRSKSLLWEAVGDSLPPLVQGHRPKQGFTFPFGIWMQGPLSDFCSPRSDVADGFLRPGSVSSIHTAFRAGKIHWSRSWALAVLQHWLVMAQQ